jgi:hypothetical protein
MLYGKMSILIFSMACLGFIATKLKIYHCNIFNICSIAAFWMTYGPPAAFIFSAIGIKYDKDKTASIIATCLSALTTGWIIVSILLS